MPIPTFKESLNLNLQIKEPQPAPTIFPKSPQITQMIPKAKN